VLLGVYLSGVVGFVEKEFANVQKPCLKKKKKKAREGEHRSYSSKMRMLTAELL
jgi:hypothetical protein